MTTITQPITKTLLSKRLIVLMDKAHLEDLSKLTILVILSTRLHKSKTVLRFTRELSNYSASKLRY